MHLSPPAVTYFQEYSRLIERQNPLNESEAGVISAGEAEQAVKLYACL